MNSRERQLAAIRHEVPDRLPVDAICVENVPAIAAYLGLAPEAVRRRLGLDGGIIAAGYTGPRSPAPDPVNEWGTAAFDDYSVGHCYPLADADSVAAIEAYPWPDPQCYDFAGAARAAHSLNPAVALRGPYWVPLFCRVCSLVGMEQALVLMVTEPKRFEALLEHAFQFTYAYCARLLDACGDDLPIFCLGDDFATQRGLLLRPEDWRRFLKPRLARLFALAKSRGKYVWFHSCGDVTSVLPDLIDSGCDVWETVQLHALPITARELKREYGRHLCFFGGVNTQHLPFATPDEVRAETLRVITALGRNGGYICGPDHHIKPDVPPANTVALFDVATGFRRRGYTSG